MHPETPRKLPCLTHRREEHPFARGQTATRNNCRNMLTRSSNMACGLSAAARAFTRRGLLCSHNASKLDKFRDEAASIGIFMPKLVNFREKNSSERRPWGLTPLQAPPDAARSSSRTRPILYCKRFRSHPCNGEHTQQTARRAEVAPVEPHDARARERKPRLALALLHERIDYRRA